MPERELQWNLPPWLDETEPEITIRYWWNPGCGKPRWLCNNFEEMYLVEDIRYVLDGVEVSCDEGSRLWVEFEDVCSEHERCYGDEAGAAREKNDGI